MVGFPVTVNINNSTFTGTTNSKGEYNFEAVANSIYNLTIGTGSEAYFSGQVAATANNAVIQVTTSFLPPSVQLEVAVILAAIPVAIVAAYYAYRRLGASR